MIGQRRLKELEFNSLDDYFEYIIESKVNGNYSQVRNLIKDLGKEQKKEFLTHLDGEIGISESDKRWLREVLIE